MLFAYRSVNMTIPKRTLSMLPSPHPAVVCRPVAEGAVLLHTETEVYFGLNEVGYRVWDLLSPTCDDVARVCEKLGHDYPEVDPAELVRDVTDLLEALETEGLVVPKG